MMMKKRGDRSKSSAFKRTAGGTGGGTVKQKECKAPGATNMIYRK